MTTKSARAEAAREQFIECRTIGHAWDRYVDTDMRAPQYGHRLSLRCTRCPTRRHDLVHRITGKVIERVYDYPDDYALAEKMNRAQWRRRYVQRITDGASPRRLRVVS